MKALPWLVARALFPQLMQNTTTTTSATSNTGSNSQNNTSTFQIPPLLSLHFEELKKEIGQFGQSFNDWVAEKRKILTDDKENFLKTLAEEADAVEGLKKQYSQLQAKKQSILQAIEQEEREYEEMISTNSELKEQRDKLASRLTEMKDKIEILHAEISREGAIYSQNQNREAEKARISKIELADFQKYLGLEIIPLPNNQTHFVFHQIDPKAPTENACSFVVDVSQEQYRVLSCTPAIPDMLKLVDDLNQHRDFYRFLKLVRQRFVALLQ